MTMTSARRTPSDASESGLSHRPPVGADKSLVEWVERIARLTRPDDIVWCDGSPREFDTLTRDMVANGTLIRLNPEHRPYSFLARSDPKDVARVEARTFICSLDPNDAGPTNNWRDPAEMKATLNDLFDGCMRGRTMYVVPFALGPLGSPLGKLGVQITDSPYVVVSMNLMTRMGTQALDLITDKTEWVPAVHSVGAPLLDGRHRRPVAVQRHQVHHPLPGNPRDLVVRFAVRRQRPAGQEGVRAAHRLGARPRRGLAGRAHAHPQGRPRRAAACSTWLPRSRRPAEKPTSPCCGRRFRAGRSRPSATTSPGFGPAPTAASARSTRRQGSSVSPPAPARRPTRRPSTRCGATPSSPTSRCVTTATCGGRDSPPRRRTT